MRRAYVNREVDEQVKKIELDLQIYGYAQADVERLAEYLFELLFITIPKGTLKPDPSYLGKVPESEELSRYSFSCGPISGVYTANASEVKFENIVLNAGVLIALGQNDQESFA
jgi:hypothetical protein